MNQRDRFLKIINHEEPDHVMMYVQGFIGNTLNEWREKIEDILTDEEIFLDPMFGDRTIRQWIGDDFIEFAIHAPHGYPRVEYPGKSNSTISPFGSITFHGGEYAGKPYSWYIGPCFDSLEKRNSFYAEHGEPWDERFWPPDHLFDEFHKKLRYLEEKNYPWMPLNRTGSLWEWLFEGLGPSHVSYLMRSKPAELRKIIDQIIRPVRYCTKRLLEEGALVVGISDDMGQKGRPLLSPKLFDEFLAPAYKQLTDMTHKAGGYFWLHSCGNITELLPGLINTGVDVWQTLEPASGVDFSYVKATYGDKLTLVGGVDASRLLPFGTNAQVETHTKERLKIGMPNGGYCIGPSHDIMDVPLANYIKMRDTVRKYGQYPLRF